MLKLYHLPGSRSSRIVWLLEELGTVPHHIETPDMVVPTGRVHMQKTPYGKFPAIEDGALKLFESAAIIDYIINKYGDGRLIPPVGSNDWALCRQWMSFADSGLTTGLNVIFWFTFSDRADNPIIKEMKLWGESSLDTLADNFGPGPFLLGDEVTAADIMIGYSLFMADKAGLTLPAPLDDYFGRLQARRGFQKGMGG